MFITLGPSLLLGSFWTGTGEELVLELKKFLTLLKKPYLIKIIMKSA